MQTTDIIKEGRIIRRITAPSWSLLEEIEQDYKRKGHRTWLDFGNICSDDFSLVVEI